jgi:hypothetical protein
MINTNTFLTTLYVVVTSPHSLCRLKCDGLATRHHPIVREEAQAKVDGFLSVNHIGNPF